MNKIEVIMWKITWGCKIVRLSVSIIFTVSTAKDPKGRPKQRWKHCVKVDIDIGLILDGGI